MDDTLQIIPSDWQRQIEHRISAMKGAMLFAQEAPLGDEHARRRHVYEAFCEDFLHYIRTSYNSVDGFDDFLKSGVREAYRIGGTADIPEGCWPERSKGLNSVCEAQDMASRYTQAYKQQIETIALKIERHAARTTIGDGTIKGLNIG